MLTLARALLGVLMACLGLAWGIGAGLTHGLGVGVSVFLVCQVMAALLMPPVDT